MNFVVSLDDKIELIRKHFSPLVGKKFSGYEYAQLWCDEKMEWCDWMGIPLFIRTDDQTLSICWSKFDELAIAPGRRLPFSLGGTTVRWRYEGLSALDSSVGKSIADVSIGRGQMTVGQNDIEIWTRLFIGFENGEVLEIFNSLDENGFDFHPDAVPVESRKCV